MSSSTKRHRYIFLQEKRMYGTGVSLTLSFFCGGYTRIYIDTTREMELFMSIGRLPMMYGCLAQVGACLPPASLYFEALLHFYFLLLEHYKWKLRSSIFCTAPPPHRNSLTPPALFSLPFSFGLFSKMLSIINATNITTDSLRSEKKTRRTKVFTRCSYFPRLFHIFSPFFLVVQREVHFSSPSNHLVTAVPLTAACGGERSREKREREKKKAAPRFFPFFWFTPIKKKGRRISYSSNTGIAGITLTLLSIYFSLSLSIDIDRSTDPAYIKLTAPTSKKAS